VDNQMMTIFIGIIALCMVIITAVIIMIGIQSLKTMQRIHEFISYTQNELSFLSTKLVLTLHETNELMTHLKIQSSALSQKSMLALHEVHDLINYLHGQTKNLVLKASNGIAKVTLGSLAIGALSQFLKKKNQP
jgi:uncharacterized protein YoxC